MGEMSIVAGREQERYYPYTGMFYANRHSFWAAGQNSWVLPPAQNQDMFTSLLNVEPVLQGILQRRRGYSFFANQNNVITTGVQAPTAAASTGSGTAWSNPNNILALDGASAIVAISSGSPTTQHLQGTNFGFALPTSANITGINLSIVCSQSSIAFIRPSLTAQLLFAGVVTGPPDTFQPVSAVLTAQNFTFTGTLPTASQINDPTFGVDVSAFWNAVSGNTTFSVDAITLSISYNFAPYTLSYSFRSESLGLREVVFTSTSNVLVTSETGQSIVPTLFTPAANAQKPRMVLSRDYGYFADGIQGDYKKFDGTQNPNNLTKWGININDIGALVFGANDATVAADQGSGGTAGSQGPLGCSVGANVTNTGLVWNNPSHIAFISDNVTSPATITFTSGGIANSDFLQASGYGFNIPATATITGISASITFAGSSPSQIQDGNINLMKANAIVGTDHATHTNFPIDGTATTINYGGPTDLWGTTWAPVDINNSGFGLSIVEHNISIGATVNGFVFAQPSITVYYTVPSVGTWSNVNGSFQNNSASPATSVASVTASSELRDTGFGLSVTPTNVVVGIKVDITCKVDTGVVNLNPILVKAGATTGSRKTLAINNQGFTKVSFGGATDMWNAAWTPSDVNAANFGVQFNVSTAAGSSNFFVDRVQVTVFTVAGPLTFVTNTTTTNIVLLNGRVYFYAFQNSKTGHTSALSPASLSTGPLTGNEVDISNIPTCTDPQVDTVLLLATLDGGDETTLYLLASLPNGTATYSDTTPDSISASFTTGATLETNAIYLDTDSFGVIHGIANNNPPPAINFPTKHKGRIYGSIGQALFFSKNLDEVTTANGLITSKWEEAWPLTNQFDISEQAETIQGLMTDGETLWIATERGIRRLVGDSPSNFQKPEVQFNETGLINQDCWKVTFFEGQPVGTLWMTPDFKVMASDFNSYQDVGTAIQDVLNSINISAVSTIHATYVAKGTADYYMLYVPTGVNVTPDTICVFNLKAKTWCIWQPTDSPLSSLFFFDVNGAPRWLFSSLLGPIYEWISGSFQDRVGNGPVTYPVTIQTTWLDMGDYGLRKFVNQIIPTTEDITALTIQVESASNEQDFISPALVVPPTVVTPAAIPDDVFVPLASGPSHHRAFRFTFTSPASTVRNVLTGFSIEAGVIHRYLWYLVLGTGLLRALFPHVG